MDIRFQPRASLDSSSDEKTVWQADAVIIPVFKGQPPFAFAPALTEASPWLEISPALRDFKGEKGKTALLYGHPDLPIPRALFVGLGRREKFKPETLREAVGNAVKELAGLKLAQLALPVESLKALAGEAETAAHLGLVEEAVLGAITALYDYTEHKSAPTADDEDQRFTPAALSLLFTEASVPEAEQKAARRAEALATGIFYARDLINGPANVVTPAYLEEAAQKLARAHGFKFSSRGPAELDQEGFGALMAVASGSAAEPRLIILESAPKGAENDKPLVIVGKGVTFDSGGISIKPATGMEKMKRDMAGAGTVLGLFKTIGVLGGHMGRRVIGIMPCAENMPDGKAARPGDVVRTLSGKTVEILNTDAEGRLLLCDALTLAQNMAEPEALIDIATLTGACVVALGEKTAGVFSNDEALIDKVLAAALAAGERVWPLPLFDEDIDSLKSLSADLGNVGPREGGALFAALFLKQFVKAETPWAHLDIAGPAYHKTNGGATAFGLRTLFELIDK